MLLLLLNLVCTLSSGEGWNNKEVTYGSGLKLVNTHYGVRLHSQEVSYAMGSGLQAVTGLEGSLDTGSHWLVEGVSPTGAQPRGTPVKCGDPIRLVHLVTSKALSANPDHESPLSKSFQEVAAAQNTADQNQVWNLVCSSKHWIRGEEVMLKNALSGSYLSVSGKVYSNPIQGQMEVFAGPRDSSSVWKTAEGLFFRNSESVSREFLFGQRAPSEL